MLAHHRDLLQAVGALHSVREAAADRLRAGRWLEHFQQSTEAWEVTAQRPFQNKVRGSTFGTHQSSLAVSHCYAVCLVLTTGRSGVRGGGGRGQHASHGKAHSCADASAQSAPHPKHKCCSGVQSLRTQSTPLTTPNKQH